MEVAIIVKETGKEVARRTIIFLQGLNHTPSDDEYFSEAWRCAVEDGVVDSDSRSKYKFSFTE